MSATFILTEEGVILEAWGDARLFFAAGRRERQGEPLSQALPELQRALGGLLRKAARGRAVENYAFSFKLGKRLMPMLASAAPYPLTGTEKAGVVLNIKSQEERMVPSRPPDRPRILPIPGLLDSEEAAAFDEGEAYADPACLLDEDGRILRSNAVLWLILGASEEDELKGSRLADRLEQEEDGLLLLQALETARLAPWRGELKLRTGEGGRAVLSVTITLLRDSRKAESVFLVAGRDHTDLHLHWEQMEKRATGLLGALENAPYPLICGRGENIVNASREAASLLGLAWERLPGMGLREALGEEGADSLRGLLGGKNEGKSAVGDTFVRRGPRGAEKTLRIRVRKVEPSGGSVEYVAGLEDHSEALELEGKAKEADRAGRFLEGMSRAFSAFGEEQAAVECLEAFVGLTGAEAGAFYLLEGDRLIPLCSRCIGEGRKVGEEGWKARPSRLPVEGWFWLKPPDEGGGRREEVQALAFLRDGDDFLRAHRRDEGERLLFLLPKWRGRVRGLLVFSMSEGRDLPTGAETVLEPGLTLAGFLLGKSGERTEGSMKTGIVEAASDNGISSSADETMVNEGWREPSEAPEVKASLPLPHRLGTLLTPVRGFAQMLEMEDLSEEELRERAKDLRVAIDLLIKEIAATTLDEQPEQEGEGGEPDH